MLTKKQATRLKTLATKLANAHVADSWKGSGDPDAIPYIEEQLKRAGEQFKRAINELVNHA